TVCYLTIFFQLVGGNEWPTFTGVCEQPGDWCTTQCQITGGSGGMCNKVKLCICRPL
ncbi:hypothetical protein KR093_007195, partial [Drosophila rubida]